MTDGRHESRDTDATERLVTAVDAARLLGVSERTVRRRIAAGTLPSVKVGTSRLVPVTALTPSPGGDSADTPGTTVRHDIVAPSVATADTAPLAALIERQGREIARLPAELAVATERLRVLAPGEDAPMTHPQPPGATGAGAAPFAPSVAAWRERTTRDVDLDAPAPWWRFWERWR
jgi:excisionase family DNA binding protein